MTTGISIRVPQADWGSQRAWFKPPLDETLGGWEYINLFGENESLTQNLSRGKPSGSVTGSPALLPASALFKLKANFISTQVEQAYAMTFFAIAKTARTAENPSIGNEFVISNNLSNGPDGGTNGASLYFSNSGTTGMMNVTMAVTQSSSPPGTPSTGQTTQLSVPVSISDKPVIIMGSYSASDNTLRVVANGVAAQLALPINSPTSIQRGAPPRIGSVGQNTGSIGTTDIEIFSSALLSRKITTEEEDVMTEWGRNLLIIKGVSY
ncbi:TPA: hypothetical protein SLG40_001561 [Serratia odorifera]|nr:hypothetical protein [Serratia odorifera]